jgi:hypothetical protein
VSDSKRPYFNIEEGPSIDRSGVLQGGEWYPSSKVPPAELGCKDSVLSCVRKSIMNSSNAIKTMSITVT